MWMYSAKGGSVGNGARGDGGNHGVALLNATVCLAIVVLHEGRKFICPMLADVTAFGDPPFAAGERQRIQSGGRGC